MYGIRLTWLLASVVSFNLTGDLRPDQLLIQYKFVKEVKLESISLSLISTISMIILAVYQMTEFISQQNSQVIKVNKM